MVGADHMRDLVPHDEVGRGLVLDFVRHGAKRVTESVEAESPSSLCVRNALTTSLAVTASGS